MKLCTINGKTYKDTMTCQKCTATKCNGQLVDVVEYTMEDAKELVGLMKEEEDVVVLMMGYINMRELKNTIQMKCFGG